MAKIENSNKPVTLTSIAVDSSSGQVYVAGTIQYTSATQSVNLYEVDTAKGQPTSSVTITRTTSSDSASTDIVLAKFSNAGDVASLRKT